MPHPGFEPGPVVILSHVPLPVGLVGLGVIIGNWTGLAVLDELRLNKLPILLLVAQAQGNRSLGDTPLRRKQHVHCMLIDIVQNHQEY